MKITKRDKKGRISKGSNLIHGLSKNAIYDCWVAMKARCLNKNNPVYKYYGGRGIRVCDEWLKFDNFYRDMGDSNGKTLDRIDVNKGYNPDNCRWVSIQQQQKNRTDNNNIVGVVFENDRNKWRADITYKGKKNFLGRFVSKNDAISARNKAERELWQ